VGVKKKLGVELVKKSFRRQMGVKKSIGVKWV